MVTVEQRDHGVLAHRRDVFEVTLVQDVQREESREEKKALGAVYQFYISELNEELISSKKQYKNMN